jgi:hypothetical protein
MKRSIPVIGLLLILAAAGCEKAELPKPLSGPSSVNTVQVVMGSDYGNQLFFELSSNTLISQNHREAWDLGFECGSTGRHIILNSSKFMAMSITASEDLAAVNGATPVEWLYDSQSGNIDSAAFHNWELNKVYIVDKGISVGGQQLGKVKMQLIDCNETSYTIRWGATLAATTFQTVTIPKSDQHNFSFFSFMSGETVAIEPQKAGWDLCFTSYTFTFADGTPYLVTGVLTNRNGVRVAESQLSFEEVDYAYASTTDYTADIDIIGYDWKVYDFDLSIYTVDFSRVYIVKAVDGLYYKLRFLDFYDSMGAKGAPTFEVQEIQP